MNIINSVLNTIKQFFKYIGQAIKLVFVFIYNLISFILNNTFGLIFTRKVTAFTNPKSNDEDNGVWKLIRTIVLISILLVFIFSFQFIYQYTLGIVFTFLLQLIGKGIGNNMYGRILVEYGASFSKGIGTTLYLSLIGTTIGFIFSLGIGVVLTFKNKPQDKTYIKVLKTISKKLSQIFVHVLRGTPMLVQAMILFFGIMGPLGWDPLIAGLIVVSVNTTAYLSEVVRGAIETIDKGQTEGSLSLGLSNFQTMIYVVFPQAIKNSMASIGNEFVINIKDTSVLSIILIQDLFRVAELANAKYSAPFPTFIIAAVIYLVLTSSVTAILRRLEKKLDLPTVNLPSAN